MFTHPIRENTFAAKLLWRLNKVYIKQYVVKCPERRSSTEMEPDLTSSFFSSIRQWGWEGESQSSSPASLSLSTAEQLVICKVSSNDREATRVSVCKNLSAQPGNRLSEQPSTLTRYFRGFSCCSLRIKFNFLNRAYRGLWDGPLLWALVASCYSCALSSVPFYTLVILDMF